MILVLFRYIYRRSTKIITYLLNDVNIKIKRYDDGGCIKRINMVDNLYPNYTFISRTMPEFSISPKVPISARC